MAISLKQLWNPSYERVFSTRMSKSTVLKAVESAGEDFYGETTADGFSIRPRTRGINRFARSVINGEIQETDNGSTVRICARVKTYYLITWCVLRILLLAVTVTSLAFGIFASSLPNILNALYLFIALVALEVEFQLIFRISVKKVLPKLEQLLLL